MGRIIMGQGTSTEPLWRRTASTCCRIGSSSVVCQRTCHRKTSHIVRPRALVSLFRSAALNALWLALITFTNGESNLTDEAQPTAQHLEFFEKEVRPLLVDHRDSCHSTKSRQVQAGLLLDSRAALLRGGDSGAAIVPGDVDASTLIEAVGDESYEMPPKGKLPADDIETLERWVESVFMFDVRAGCRSHAVHLPIRRTRYAFDRCERARHRRCDHLTIRPRFAAKSGYARYHRPSLCPKTCTMGFQARRFLPDQEDRRAWKPIVRLMLIGLRSSPVAPSQPVFARHALAWGFETCG